MAPISFWAQMYFFLAVIHLFDITYLSKWLFHSETPFKMLKLRGGVKMTETTFRGCQTLVLMKRNHIRVSISKIRCAAYGKFFS